MRFLILFLLLTISSILPAQNEAEILNCYELLKEKGQTYEKQGQFLQAINQYTAARECNDANAQRRKTMDHAIEQARRAQQAKERAEAERARRLTEKMAGEETYKAFLERGIAKFREGAYQDAIYDFAVAQFTRETKDVNEWITRAEWGLLADSLYWENATASALSWYEKAVAQDTTADYSRRQQQECQDILQFWSEYSPGTVLDLSEYPFKTIPNAFFEWESVQGLRFVTIRSNYKLQQLPDSFGQLAQLQSLDISGNDKLQQLPDSFGQLTQLQSLDISGNDNLQQLPDSFGQLAQLQSLYISGNGNLQQLPDSFGQLAQLQSLVIRDNDNLQQLPDSFGQLTQLQSLVIRYNPNLQQLPDSFGQLPQLQSLVISDNANLQQLPDSFGQLAQLQSLVIRDNANLQQLPDSFGQLPQLQSLDIRYNPNLQQLPDSFGQLAQLQSLVIRDNDNLQQLPDNFGQLALDSLTLAWNPDWAPIIGRLDSLEFMQVAGSRLDRLPETLRSLPKFRSLTINYNSNLQQLPDSFGQLAQLQSLVISDNDKLQQLPDSFGQLTQLQSLVIRDNDKLQQLPGVSN